MRGFLVAEFADDFEHASKELATWIQEGKIKTKVSIEEGFEYLQKRSETYLQVKILANKSLKCQRMYNLKFSKGRYIIMKAIGFKQPFKLEGNVFETFELDMPQPSSRELLVKIQSISVNRLIQNNALLKLKILREF